MKMAKWKLTRQLFGDEEFLLSEGDTVTVGRGINNSIVLSSVVISRNHCLINVQNNEALITDLQSSNGVYVGTVKIQPNTPYVIKDSDVIGLGWTPKAPLVNINDNEKYVFQFNREETKAQLTKRPPLIFQSDNELDEIAKFIENPKNKETLSKSPVLSGKLTLKRKNDNNFNIKTEKKSKAEIINNNIIKITDSDGEIQPRKIASKKPKLQLPSEEPHKQLLKNNEIKNENELIAYDAFSIKQENIGYDDEPINIDSDSDSESEQWLLRLSQNSPGKPFIKMAKSIKTEVKPEDGSYSQLDDDFICHSLRFEEDEYEDDIISINKPEEKINEVPDNDKLLKTYEQEEYSDDIISIPKTTSIIPSIDKEMERDEVDGFSNNNLSIQSISVKKAQMIEPLAQLPKGKSHRLSTQTKSKSSLSKHSKLEKSKSTKQNISTTHREERKKKLKELAIKDKDSETSGNKEPLNTNKRVPNVKVTSSNRGAFLSESAQAIVKAVKRKEDCNKSKERVTESSPTLSETKKAEFIENFEKSKNNSVKSIREKSKGTKHKDRETENKPNNTLHKLGEQETRVPLKSLKPLTDSDDSYSGKPVSKVNPMPTDKQKKKVRFSEAAPQVLEYQIETGNRMKKTSLVKTSLVDVRQTPVFSLEKITLMKILRWNPHWLEEQENNSDPPPILGHNNTPMTLFHSFVNHSQYVQFVGDLLLMEIWECLTIGYKKIKHQTHGLQMKIESIPPTPSQERCFEIFNTNVNVSLLPSETRNLPRVGEIMLVTFGPQNARIQRFFFVHNVRQLPSPLNQSRLYYSISLHATVSEKRMLLMPGEIITGKSLAHINKELMLFEAMDYLAGSPLCHAVLKPERQHFTSCNPSQIINMKSQWTATLNPSQLKAVNSSVVAALSDKPSIQMIQGPPGTGKSSVICAIVMTYFYNPQGKKQQNRGKILICASSNAAVDGLVLKLLNLRQSLPQPERFRMVRVGRAEAMHPVAADVSSQQLARRDVTRVIEPPQATPGLNEEILHLEAKINMWKTQERDAKDPERVAYCQGRVADLAKRITLLRSGSGGGRGEEVRPDQLAASERRIIEGADIVVTTLSSAQNHKMRGLKRRIALCIIDEAGQVIEPETLIPLTLDVTRLTLIGDPQQLPGFICSQRAKKHGLGESLFSRLTSCSDEWGSGSPMILLNKQYRMHSEIADYPSRAFYGGMVHTVDPTRPNIQLPPYTIISITSGDKGQGLSGANEMEAWGVTRLALALDAMLRPLKVNLAVITPYNAHKEVIKKQLRLQTQGECPVEVDTVDRFQGQERDVVVVSLARSQGVGFLTDAGRMNVMLTRAKHALFICLNPFAMLKNHQWRTLIEDAQRRDLYVSLPNKMCQPLTPGQNHKDDILKYIINGQCSGSRL